MRNGLSDSFSTGIDAARQLPEFIRRKAAEYRVRVANRDVPSQREKIRELVGEDEFLLIILDSCRFDFFAQEFPSYFEGDLQQVYTANTYTKQYQQSTWPDEYDVTYVAGGPVITDRNFELSNMEYRPSEHFDEILHVWDRGYKKELGVTPPEAVSDAAMKRDAPRMIVHYFQPHAPYIGEYRLRDGAVDEASGEQSKIEVRRESLIEIYDRIEGGEIDQSALVNAYRSNLQRVLEAAKPLVANASRRTVITADHGELLGEDGRYLHGGVPHQILCQLPWFEVDSVVGSVDDLSVEWAEGTQSEKNVKEQLQDLGYM